MCSWEAWGVWTLKNEKPKMVGWGLVKTQLVELAGFKGSKKSRLKGNYSSA